MPGWSEDGTASRSCGGACSAAGLKGVKLETLDLQLAGDEETAYEVGEATLDLQPAGGDAATAIMKYVIVWVKIDGAWRLHRDIWNANP